MSDTRFYALERYEEEYGLEGKGALCFGRAREILDFSGFPVGKDLPNKIEVAVSLSPLLKGKRFVIFKNVREDFYYEDDRFRTGLLFRAAEKVLYQLNPDKVRFEVWVSAKPINS